ncbi:MAG: nicotinate-nucleotide--dimethylbenzimidazole phosphoribosyltransferase [Anaerosomatales bacterium]|nr:nicotinate-nucleotide--dimethylbenzimidazole phosphoribosyltransferase [Anaerosomatales bacterium]MDT8433479.1 nicotinate-nucleotide--dimethylbenzimidazole phosphoribosyltransferase [Anaerosomatales bacterium]
MDARERIRTLLDSVRPTDPAAERRAWARLDTLTKPPRSLGRLEEVAAAIARIQGTDRPSVTRKAIILMAGDHGVVAEGVSPYPQSVTWQMVANFAAGGAAINQIASSVGADLLLYDLGVVGDTSVFTGVNQAKVVRGTANMRLGPALTRDQAVEALLAGAQAASEAADGGVALLGTGEMGIGNTTAAAALTAAYTGAPVERVVGPGTGLDHTGVAHKMAVVRDALARNVTPGSDALDILAALGGAEIAGLAGVMLGGSARGVCVLVDGFISGAAALAAVALCPSCRDHLLASHRSLEPGHTVQLDHLGMAPVLDLDLRLGEGTGAALSMGLVDAACRMLSGMATFEEAGVSGSESA